METSASFEARSAHCLTRQLYEPQPHKLVTHRFAMNDMLKPDAVLRQATMRADRAELCTAQA